MPRDSHAKLHHLEVFHLITIINKIVQDKANVMCAFIINDV